jgi:DNA-damage-inducible protein J
MAAQEVVRARIDSELKKQATAVLAEMGLSVSDAIRLLLVRVAAERALPFDVRTPNHETHSAMLAAQRGDVARSNNIADLMVDLNDDKT